MSRKDITLLFCIIVMVLYENSINATQIDVAKTLEGSVTNVSDLVKVDLGGEYYYFDFSSVAFNWMNAQELCRQQSLVAVSIETPEEHILIQDYLRASVNSQKLFWTSGSDWTNGQSWTWSTKGVPITYNGWAPGYPVSNRSCLWLTDTVDYFFSDVNCEVHGIGYICEEFFKPFST